MMPPTKGRMVFFVLKCGTARPATVVEARGERLDLRVDMTPNEEEHESNWQPDIGHSPISRPGTWHWPERKGEG